MKKNNNYRVYFEAKVYNTIEIRKIEQNEHINRICKNHTNYNQSMHNQTMRIQTMDNQAMLDYVMRLNKEINNQYSIEENSIDDILNRKLSELIKYYCAEKYSKYLKNIKP